MALFWNLLALFHLHRLVAVTCGLILCILIAACSMSEHDGSLAGDESLQISGTNSPVNGPPLNQNTATERVTLLNLPQSIVLDIREIGSTSSDEMLFKVAVAGNAGSRSALSSPVLGQLNYDPSNMHFVELEWEDDIESDEKFLTLVLDKGTGTMQFGACLAGGMPAEFSPGLPVCTVRFRMGARRKPAAALDLSMKALSRVPDLEAIYLHDYDEGSGPGTDSAELSDILLTWSYALIGDADSNTIVNINDLTPIGAYFGRTTDFDYSFVPSQAQFPKDDGISYFPSEFQSILHQVDTDGNGLITIADLTPIGNNFTAEIKAWTGNYSDGMIGQPLTFDNDHSQLGFVKLRTADGGATEGVTEPTGSSLRRYQFCRSIGTPGLLSTISGNPSGSHSFSLTSHFGEIGGTGTPTAVSLKREASYAGVDTANVSISSALINSSMGAGPVTAITLATESYVIVAASTTASQPNRIEVFEYDRQSTPPELLPTSNFSQTISELNSIQSISTGNFGAGYNLAVLGRSEAAIFKSRLALFKLSSAGLLDKSIVDIPISGETMLVGDLDKTIIQLAFDELVVMPDSDSSQYNGYILAYKGGVAGFQLREVTIGEAVNAALIDDIFFVTQNGATNIDHLLALVSKNSIPGGAVLVSKATPSDQDLFSLPAPANQPLGGLLADYGRSLPETDVWDLSDVSRHPYITSGMPFPIDGMNSAKTIAMGFKELPLFSHQMCTKSNNPAESLAMTRDDFCIELYRNLVSPSGEYLEFEARGLDFCSLASSGDRDIAYITSDAIGWRIGTGERFLWSDNYPTYLSNPQNQNRRSTFGPIHLIGESPQSASTFSPGAMCCKPLLGVSDLDDIVASVQLGSEFRLIVVSFQ